MRQRLRSHLTYANVISTLALFLVLGGGAYAVDGPLAGQNQVGSEDIINGEVKTPDLGADSVSSGKIIDGQVKSGEVLNDDLTAADLASGSVAGAEVKDATVANVDVAPNTLASGRILDGTLTGTDVANNSLKGADIDEATLDVGDAARAYAAVNAFTCTGPAGACSVTASKGISGVTRGAPGTYCVVVPGIDPSATPAAVTVDWASTPMPVGNASATTYQGGSFCGPSGQRAFLVITERQPVTGGTTVGPASFADDVSFTIVIP